MNTTYNVKAKIKTDLITNILPSLNLTIESDNEQHAAELIALKLIETLEVDVTLTRPEIWNVKPFGKDGKEVKMIQSDNYGKQITVSPKYYHWYGRAFDGTWQTIVGFFMGTLLGLGLFVIFFIQSAH